MTDNEIIKALECCSTSNCSKEKCPYYNVVENCYEKIDKDALDLIKRQRLELEKLQKFKAFFESFCGCGLEILGYTENGGFSPFDDFYKEAVKEMEEVHLCEK